MQFNFPRASKAIRNLQTFELSREIHLFVLKFVIWLTTA